MNGRSDYETNYRVEISGWDIAENFFVEKTILKWNEDGVKRVSLRNPISENAIVFIRLSEPSASGSGFPVAYQAIEVSAPDSRHMFQISLAPVRARRSEPIPTLVN
jgi:hypothetical protein